MPGGEVVAVVAFVPTPGSEVELRAALERGMRRSSLVSGCLVQSLTEGESGELVLVEKWASHQQLSAHMQGSLVAELLESYRGLLAVPPVPRLVPPRPVDLCPEEQPPGR